MNRPLLISLATASLLLSSLNADTMYERFQAMEKEMKSLKSEIATLKNEQPAAQIADEEDEDKAQTALSKDDDEDESVTDSDDDEKESAAQADDEDDEKESAAQADDEDDEDEDEPKGDAAKIAELEDTIADMQEDIDDLNTRTNGNALKFGVDFRSAIDNLNYKMANGDKAGNDALLTNRLWLNMNWKASSNLSFTGQLAYNKAFGYRSGFGGAYPGFETFDWITNENAYDDTVRIRSAYFFYRQDTLFGSKIPWTFSVGRRPSTNGHLVNLRDDDKASSPMAHNINVEFDGASAKMGLAELTGIDGMYLKFCAGRGGSNASAKFFTVDMQKGTPNISAPYATNSKDIPDIDLAGLIFVPYNNGQYQVATQYYYAANLIDANMKNTPNGPVFTGMDDVGGMHAFTANFRVDGIGDEISDFLDDTIVFMSAAWSITNPKSGGQGMLGSQESKTGSSFWIGAQFPSLISDGGRWGVEYNHGDKYWRSITYAEDTNIGSKLAARGSAYELYFTEPLHEDILSFQLRFTYIDYDYTGSNGFFGSSTGTPVDIKDLKDSPYGAVSVDTAQDIRAYLRYRF